MSINETVLEMHFHESLIELIRSAFGLGASGHFNFYKYSPQQECFVGFDQAFVKTQDSDQTLFKSLKAAAESSDYVLPKTYVGYFLQFKVVSKIGKKDKRNPAPNPPIVGTPFYRSELKNQRSKTSKFSQHELLFNLCKNKGAMTYYACPMVFSKEDLYAPVELSKLRLVDVSSAPSAFQDNKSHYLYFQTEFSEAFWCSEPAEGRSISANQFVEDILVRSRRDARESARLLNDVLGWLKHEGRGLNDSQDNSFGGLTDFVADALTIVEIDRSEIGAVNLE